VLYLCRGEGNRLASHPALPRAEHPIAEWTTQQFREVLADLHPYRFVIHDRDSILSPSFDSALNDFGVRILRTPVQAPKANAYCERLVGTIRRECLDYVMP
jgi:transposase InsO family protein